MNAVIKDENLKKEVIYLGRNGFNREQVNSILNVDLTNSTFYRIKGNKDIKFTQEELVELKTKFSNLKPLGLRELDVETEKAAKEVQKEIKVNNDLYGQIDEKLEKYFKINLDDLLNTSEQNIVEKRDLMIIADEFEKCFNIPVTEDIVYSFQEKYVALQMKKVDALKIILDKIHYIYRRTLSDTHSWKFKDDDIKGKTNKIMGHTINLIKDELDGSCYRALSEQQHKMVDFFKTLLNKNGEFSLEVEQKMMQLQARFNVFDIVNASVLLAKNYNPELEFLNKVEELLK